MSYSPQSPLTLEELAPLLATLPSPCYAVDLDRLEANLEILGNVQKEAGCKILLAPEGLLLPGSLSPDCPPPCRDDRVGAL